MVFPVILYSNSISSSDGVSIAYDYNKDDYPEIFAITAKEENVLPGFTKGFDGINRQKSFSLKSSCFSHRKKEHYILVSRIRGGLEILKATDNKE